MLTRRALIGIAAAAPFVALSARIAAAKEPETYATNGIAINGTDPVAYFTDGGPVRGSADFTTNFKGASWHFTSAENRDTFLANPEKYGAQYGGYCAFAASRGYVATTVPEAWTIHNDKLYLNFSLGVRRRWLRNLEKNIEAGDANWPGILG
ncbi:MAG: YHS domain-containing (seleno)protein [Pseudomonadota bacterium]